MVSATGTPAVRAMSAMTSWSKEPPPVHATWAGSARQALTRSSMLWYGESAGTTTRLYSSTTRLTAVTWESSGPVPRAAWAAIWPVPPTMRLFASSSVVSWPRAMLPPAPGMLTTWTLFTSPLTRMVCCSSRWNESQPPPRPRGR